MSNMLRFLKPTGKKGTAVFYPLKIGSKGGGVEEKKRCSGGGEGRMKIWGEGEDWRAKTMEKTAR